MRTEDPNSYWEFWKSLNPGNVTTGDYFDYEHMNNIIKQVTSFQHYVTPDKSNMTQFLKSPVTAEEIKKAIQKLKCKQRV